MNFINSMIGDNADDEPSTLLDLAIAVVAVQGCIFLAYFLSGVL
ncbi:hypothetical protein J2X90_000736 [Variovorax paradoxus]|nr:hypothetical protein [Variovorax paradoxus]MDQ0022950.1 hypothetical protein [Variovorax paradoxus]